jgi:hypothetical protein
MITRYPLINGKSNEGHMKDGVIHAQEGTGFQHMKE